ncbi:MAG: LacI family DNA-binding transcriptional regulator [Burkholderiaceae bacterium]|nr:LacI family DNA-binding transcriptional regulator [Burkholderiaceae bacterium]
MNLRRASAPTIMDVARHAQVSMKTVSRVLNNEPNVVPAMRERVMASVAALGYRPNLHARSLARSRSSLLGLLYYASSAAFVMGLQRGATARCRALDYHLVVEQLDDSGEHLAEQLHHMLTALRPDGLILAPPVCDATEVLQLLAQDGTPCVRISPSLQLPGFGCVSIDDHAAAQALTTALIALGHRRIGYICGHPAQIAAPRRLAGHRAALQAHGLPQDEALIVPGDFRFASGLDGCSRLLALQSPPTAVIAANDDMAMGALAAAQRLGLQVPRDLSVAGFDDGPLASLVWPALSTVRQPVADMAEAAVDMLVQRSAAGATGGDAVADTTGLAERQLPYQLVMRDSTAAPR